MKALNDSLSNSPFSKVEWDEEGLKDFLIIL